MDERLAPTGALPSGLDLSVVMACGEGPAIHEFAGP